MFTKRQTPAADLAALFAPYRGAVPTVDPLRRREGALNMRIMAARYGMTPGAYAEHCRSVIADARPIRTGAAR